MDDLSPQQYEAVLKYMQISNEDDFQNASTLMVRYQYKLENALNRTYGSDNSSTQDHQNQREEQKTFESYVDYLREKQKPGQFMKNICSSFGVKMRKLCTSCSKTALPCIPDRMFGPEFKKIYLQSLAISIKTDLQKTVSKAQRKSRPCLVLLSNSTINHCLLEFMQNQTIAKQINKSFEVVGMIEGQYELSAYPELMHQQAPSILVCRRDITEKVTVIRRYLDESRIAGFNAREVESVLQEFQRQKRMDSNALRRFHNENSVENVDNRLISSMFSPHRDTIENEAELDDQTETEDPAKSSRMIHQQNTVYKEIEEQAMRKRLRGEEQAQIQQQQKQKEQEVDQQRKLRKMSIPEEPLQGNLVRLSFRCPQGNIVIRNFPMNQKMELIYNWVETNDEIEFQNQAAREFDLFMSYPPVSLLDRKEDLLSDVFEDDQDKIMIREL